MGIITHYSYFYYIWFRNPNPMTTKTKNSPHHRILSCYITIAKLISLLDESGLSPEVKTYCITGLKVIGILYADKHGNTGIERLFNPEFDAFYKRCPKVYYKHRGLISVDAIMANIEICMSSGVLTDIAG